VSIFLAATEKKLRFFLIAFLNSPCYETPKNSIKKSRDFFKNKASNYFFGAAENVRHFHLIFFTTPLAMTARSHCHVCGKRSSKQSSYLQAVVKQGARGGAFLIGSLNQGSLASSVLFYKSRLFVQLLEEKRRCASINPRTSQTVSGRYFVLSLLLGSAVLQGTCMRTHSPGNFVTESQSTGHVAYCCVLA
jgi:hypothetical protein